jgi:hypothetical protein
MSLLNSFSNQQNLQLIHAYGLNPNSKQTVFKNFLFLTQSTITSFFTSNLIDIPITLKTSSSLFYKSFELPLLRFTNYLMRGGLRGPALKNFTKAMFLFSKTWIDLQLTSLNVFTFSQLYSFLNSTLFTKNHFSNFLISNSGSVFLHEHSLGGNIISPKPNRSLKTLLLKELNKFNPLFNFYIEKVDKSILKNSRNKTDKLKLI